MRTAVRAFATDKIPREQVVRFGWLAMILAIDLWDDNTWSRAADRYLRVIRDSGALSALPLALNTREFVDLAAGNDTAAVALVEELNSVTESDQVAMTPHAVVALAAFRGPEAPVAQFIATTRRTAIPRGEGIEVSLTCWAHAVLCNGLGRYAEALAAAREARGDAVVELGAGGARGGGRAGR